MVFLKSFCLKTLSILRYNFSAFVNFCALKSRVEISLRVWSLSILSATGSFIVSVRDDTYLEDVLFLIIVDQRECNHCFILHLLKVSKLEDSIRVIHVVSQLVHALASY
jgi:hypothetical protein